NTIRCGFEGGLDPAPGNRVHLEVCYEVLTWERDCVTSYNQDGIGQKECSEWILVGSYMIGNCFSANGGGNGTAYYSPWSEDGMDCNSFDFQKTTDAEWQEAGLTDIEFKLYKLEAHRRRTTPITVKISSPIVFGLPLRGPNGEYYSAGRAGNIAADACDKAYYSLQLWLDNNPTIPAMEELEQRYRTLVRDCMRMRGGTASPTGSGSPNIIYNKAKYRWFGNGKCW
ncbi:MAG TPA: hypothetical protein VD996_06580, partial [Chitinophagaceae bacterium]|nr:hypothetical protein [Chitinophagaceae bacterium]